MTEISAKQLVGVPRASAERLLRAFFSAHPGPQGAARLVLHASSRVRYPAVVTLTPAQQPGDLTPRYAVHWEPDGGGPYPVFDGHLSVGSTADDAFPLILDGGYRPPLGIPGKVFLAVLGHRIAGETARAFLVDVAREIEAHVAQEEAAKRR